MVNLPSLDDFMRDIAAAASGVLQKDVTTITGFAKSQQIKLTKFAIWIGEAELAHEFDGIPGLRDEFLQSLQDMIRDFINTLRGLTAITIEKIWNAIVDVIWTTLDRATGLTLPRPI
jgi:hypothetical protein